MDIKELIKFQFVSQLGAGAASVGMNTTKGGTSLYSVIMNFLMFMMMSVVDDISKGVPAAFLYVKNGLGGYFTTKVKETIENRPKSLNETSVSLSTRHFVNSLKMKRIYKNETATPGGSGSNNDTSSLEESNAMVDAVLVKIAKLDNIPTLDLIDNGKFMITYKDKPIQIGRELFVKIDNVDISGNGSINSLRMTLLSNTMSAAEIGKYIKEVYHHYLQEMKNSLGNNIYFFDQKSKDGNAPPPPPNCDPGQIMNHKRMLINTAPKQLAFTMMPFYSNKKFNNIYGEEIRLVEKRVKFFMENKDWYDSKGVPYQLGILLSGIPGAGKTSVIRAIANYTKRHIINVNFANITTATQLKNLFYCDKVQVYTDQSMAQLQSYFIPVDQRIYVLEEIDAIGDIVRQRKNNVSDEIKSTIIVNDELTLMEILTVLDGTMEIPGRIVIMTTNHPEVLDSALIRPGRIDVKINFDYARRDLIIDMFRGYFDVDFPRDKVEMLPDKLLSPAEVGQVFFKYFGQIGQDTIDTIIDDLNRAADIRRPPPPVASVPEVAALAEVVENLGVVTEAACSVPAAEVPAAEVPAEVPKAAEEENVQSLAITRQSIINMFSDIANYSLDPSKCDFLPETVAAEADVLKDKISRIIEGQKDVLNEKTIDFALFQIGSAIQDAEEKHNNRQTANMYRAGATNSDTLKLPLEPMPFSFDSGGFDCFEGVCA